MTIRTLTNTLLFLIVSVIIFPGLCMFTAFFLSIIGVMSADEGVKLFTFGFDLYGIR